MSDGFAQSPASTQSTERERVSRSGSDKRARNQVVMVRLTPDEKERFAALAARKGRSLPDLLRLAAEAALISEAIHARETGRG